MYRLSFHIWSSLDQKGTEGSATKAYKYEITNGRKYGRVKNSQFTLYLFLMKIQGNFLFFSKNTNCTFMFGSRIWFLFEKFQFRTWDPGEMLN
jgi:hypothetical protein